LLYLALTLTLGCVLCVLCGQTQGVQVETEGRAAGDQKTAREQALADALREAVRKGTWCRCARIERGLEFRFGF
jgi:hypothetical protein